MFFVEDFANKQNQCKVLLNRMQFVIVRFPRLSDIALYTLMIVYIRFFLCVCVCVCACVCVCVFFISQVALTDPYIKCDSIKNYEQKRAKPDTGDGVIV